MFLNLSNQWLNISNEKEKKLAFTQESNLFDSPG